MSLRSEAIEAMARAWVEIEGGAWSEMGSVHREDLSEVAEHQLDALLDYLTAHVQMWSDGEGHPYCQTAHGSAAECQCPSDEFVHWMLSVLRVEEGDNK